MLVPAAHDGGGGNGYGNGNCAHHVDERQDFAHDLPAEILRAFALPQWYWHNKTVRGAGQRVGSSQLELNLPEVDKGQISLGNI